MTDAYIWSQIFGGIAIPLAFVRFSKVSRRSILLWGVPVGLALILSQWFNGQIQGMAMTSAAMLSSFSQSWIGLNTKSQRFMRIGLGLAFGVAGVVFFPPSNSWITWIPFGAYLVSRLGETQHNFLRMRGIWLVATVLWLAYHALCHNWANAILETMVLAMSMRFLMMTLREPDLLAQVESEKML